MRFYSLATRNLKEIFRDPVSVLLGLAMPVLMLFLFASLNKRVPLEIFSPQYLTPGIVIFSFTFLIMFSAMLIAKDKQSAFLIRLFTTPLKPSDYILSYILPFLPLALLQVVVCFTLGTILGGVFVNIFVSMLILLLVAFLCICLGVILGSIFTQNQVSGIGSLMITTIGLVSGVWMDLKMVGGLFEKIGYALPFAHAVDVLKVLMTGKGSVDMTGSILIVIAYAVVFFILAVLSFRRCMKRI